MNNLIRIISNTILLSIVLDASDIRSYPSYSSFVGVVNTPNALVKKEGEIEVLINNQVNNMRTNNTLDFRNDKSQENYSINLGVLQNLDMNLCYSYGIDSNDKEYISGRSLSFKYQLPFISNDIASIALGIEDIGGGNRNFSSSYIVISKEFKSLRASLGYAYKYSSSNLNDSLDGLFGSIEYQAFDWLQIAGEYDTKEWNGVLKSSFDTNIGNQKVSLGVMAKSSTNYNKTYIGSFISTKFNSLYTINDFTQTFNDLKLNDSFHNFKKLSNYSIYKKENNIYVSYENSLYSANDIDALNLVLRYISTNYNSSDKIIVNIKKANITQYTLSVNTKEYINFLKTGKYTPNLIKYRNEHIFVNKENNSDLFRPIIRIEPSFILVDGSEYGHMDYTLSANIALSMRLAKGLIVSIQNSIPISLSDNFDKNGIFDYRNRNKFEPQIDQAILSQYFGTTYDNYKWMNVVQAGLFDYKLYGGSWHSGIIDNSGKHLLMVKLGYFKDDLYQVMDKYSNSDIRKEMLISYRYYSEELNSNIKLTAGEFLYGDKGVSLSFRRFFGDMNVKFDLAYTEHNMRGDNKIAKLAISIPLGSKRYKTKYFDIEGGNFNYERRKTVVTNHKTSYAQPLHLKEIDNDLTLENYYLDGDRNHPSYVKNNINNLLNPLY